MTQLHNAARELAKRGCAIFPLQPRDKTPVSRNGFKDATTNLKHIDTWWGANPALNIGCATGMPSGFWVLDVDGEAGEASLRKLEEANAPLPPSVEVITGKGRHVYFRLGKHGTVGCSVGLLGEGLDTRGDNGYTVMPPSVHPSGRVYAWSVDSASDFAEAPEWLHSLIKNVTGNGKGKTLAEWHSVLTEPLNIGKRDSTLASIAGKLFDMGADLLFVLDMLLCVNDARCQPPLPLKDIERIATSIARKHANKLIADKGLHLRHE